MDADSKSSESADKIRLGQFNVHRRRCEIVGRGGAVKVSPKAIQVLDCLVAARGDSVTRETFIARVWDDNYVVGDHGLRDAVWELRKALGDNPRSPQYIQTLPRKGYRLLVTAGQNRFPYLKHVLGAGATAAVFLLVYFSGRPGAPLVPENYAWLTPPPEISGDGNWAAFLREVDGQEDLFITTGSFEDAGTRMLEAAPDSGQAIQLTHSSNRELSPVWAPNHRDLAFLEFNPHTRSCLVRVYRADSRSVVTIADDCHVVTSPIGVIPAQLAWHPDGHNLVYQARGQYGEVNLNTVSAKTGDRQVLTRPHGGIDAFPRWSESGQLAFLRLQDPMMGYAQLHVVSPREKRHLSCGTFPMWALAWTDDRHVAVTAAVNNPFELWLLDTSTGAAFATGITARYLRSRPLAGALLIDLIRQDGPLRRLGLDGSAPRALALPGRPLSVDAHQETGVLAVVDASSGQQHLRLVRENGQPELLFSAAEIYRPRFSPDGHQLAFTTRNSRQQNVSPMTIDLETGAARPLTSPPFPGFFSAWSRDARSYFGLIGVPAPFGRGADLVWFRDNGQVIEHIARDAALNVAVDGAGGVWWSNDKGEVFRRPGPGTADRLIHKLSSVYEAWTVDSQSQTLYFSETEPWGTEIRAWAGTPFQVRSVASLEHNLDPRVGLTLGPDDSLFLLRSTAIWQKREAFAIGPLMDAANFQQSWNCRLLPPQDLTAFRG
ncbi:MAG: winged helix-turn-helix domain-containing protein [Xanthomonadales bacterium]|nr:winged helix-turn-helix domain-containing protein [Xanthomonadales bacterium]